MIVAEAGCRYLSPLRLAERVTIRIRVSEIRNSSFIFDYEITGEDGRLAVTARTVQVCYDYQAGRAIRMPRAWREAIIAHEPALQADPGPGREQETTL